MKTKILAVIEAVPVIILVLAAIIFVPLPSPQPSGSALMSGSSMTSSASGPADSSAPPPFVSVGIAGIGGEGGGSYFTPSLVVVKAGGSVTWSDSDSVHDVTFGNVTPPDTKPGRDRSYTFEVPGTYHYFRGCHVWTAGTVEAQARQRRASGCLAMPPSAFAPAARSLSTAV